MGETVEWSDKRSALRQRTLKQGRALVNGVEVALVTVRNMSLTGARLVSPDCGGLPDTFTLTVGDEGLTRDVEVRSRSATGMGIRFLKPLSTSEFGAEFLHARTGESRERDMVEQRADLVRRAREGLERMDLGFVAPPIAMPDPDAPDEVSCVPLDMDGEEGESPCEPIAFDMPPPDGEPPVTERTRGEGENEDGVDGEGEVPTGRADAPDPDAPCLVSAEHSSPRRGEHDDGLGDGDLARVDPAHPPRAVRARLPWAHTRLEPASGR